MKSFVIIEVIVDGIALADSRTQENNEYRREKRECKIYKSFKALP